MEPGVDATFAITAPVLSNSLLYLSLIHIFMGVYAIHPEYGMTIPYPEEVSIKRQLIHSSSRVIALVNPIKLNTVSRYQVCGIEDFTTLITDGNVPQEMASRYKNRGLDFL